MDTIVICTLTGLVILLRCAQHRLWSGSRRRADNFRLYCNLWGLGFYLHRSCHVLLRIQHNHRLGLIRFPLYRIFRRRKARPSLPCSLFLCIDHRCNNQPWSALGYCRYLQRSDGDSQPDRPACSLRAGQEACDRCRSGGKERHVVKQLHRHTIECMLREHSIVMNNRADCQRSALLLCHPSLFSISPRNFFTAAVT